MLKLKEQGHEVDYLCLSFCGNYSLKQECILASKILGVIPVIHDFPVRCFSSQPNKIADILYKRDQYDFVFTHSGSDRHPDHRTVAEASLRIFNCSLLTYISPWNGHEQPNFFVEITKSQLDQKIDALSCYKSQAHRHYMSPEFIRAQAIYNGVKCVKQYAEGFRSLRLAY